MQRVEDALSNIGADATRIGERVGERMSDAIEEGYVVARRAVRRGRHAAEDLIDETSYRIKRDPLSAVAVTFGVGLGLGSIVGWLLTRRRR